MPAASRAGRPRIRNAEIARRIETNAVRLVLERGFDDVTVDQICAASGVAQRTFFNYYGTKQAAVLGHDLPSLDEQAVRRFLSGDGDLLAGALTLVRPAQADLDDPELGAARIRAIQASPALLWGQMERFEAIRGEVGEVLALRLRRDARPGESEDELHAQALLLAEIVAALLRFAALEAGADEGRSASEHILGVSRALTLLLPKLLPAPGG